jgi:hypothetical protein
MLWLSHSEGREKHVDGKVKMLEEEIEAKGDRLS